MSLKRIFIGVYEDRHIRILLCEILINLLNNNYILKIKN